MHRCKIIWQHCAAAGKDSATLLHQCQGDLHHSAIYGERCAKLREQFPAADACSSIFPMYEPVHSYTFKRIGRDGLQSILENFRVGNGAQTDAAFSDGIKTERQMDALAPSSTADLFPRCSPTASVPAYFKKICADELQGF